MKESKVLWRSLPYFQMLLTNVQVDSGRDKKYAVSFTLTLYCSFSSPILPNIARQGKPNYMFLIDSSAQGVQV